MLFLNGISDFIFDRESVYIGIQAKRFDPLNSNKSYKFNMLSITNEDRMQLNGPYAAKTKFLDHVVDVVQRLVKQLRDTPTETKIQQICDTIKV